MDTVGIGPRKIMSPVLQATPSMGDPFNLNFLPCSPHLTPKKIDEPHTETCVINGAWQCMKGTSTLQGDDHLFSIKACQRCTHETSKVLYPVFCRLTVLDVRPLIWMVETPLLIAVKELGVKLPRTTTCTAVAGLTSILCSCEAGSLCMQALG